MGGSDPYRAYQTRLTFHNIPFGEIAHDHGTLSALRRGMILPSRMVTHRVSYPPFDHNFTVAHCPPAMLLRGEARER
jgi:hypothetical protein